MLPLTLRLLLVEKKELPAMFVEQAHLIKALKAFRARAWNQQAVSVKTLSGAISVPLWITTETTNSQELKPTHAGKKNSAIMVSSEPKFLPTFVCPHEDCHKIFDSRAKRRRHLLF